MVESRYAPNLRVAAAQARHPAVQHVEDGGHEGHDAADLQQQGLA